MKVRDGFLSAHNTNGLSIFPLVAMDSEAEINPIM
jgi:hypothetical protein